MLKKLTNEYQKLLLNNRRQTDGFSYTIPSPDTYPYQWLWDSCFHAIILSGLNIEDAKAEILSLLSQQFQNGMIPHMIYWENHEKVTFPKIQWGKDVTSTITQPPMIAYAIWQIFQKDKEVDFLKNTYRHLYHFYRYLLNERDPHEKHLIGIMNPDESGEDNSPRFDLPLGLPPQHTFEENIQKRLNLVAQNIECKFDAPFCMRNFFWVKDVPFNAIMVENLRILSQIASKLDFGEDASFFAAEAEKIVLAMRKYMFEDNLFWPTFGENYQKIKIKTWAIFAPLFAQILTKKE
ncbi:MAG: Trehalase-like protein, partial [Candidatus Daviesbacteria bacterium GW2011_GWB1_39_5]